jgi:hypothetical protein
MAKLNKIERRYMPRAAQSDMVQNTIRMAARGCSDEQIVRTYGYPIDEVAKIASVVRRKPAP